MPLESGNLNVQLGRRELPLAHPLCTLELSQGALSGAIRCDRRIDELGSNRKFRSMYQASTTKVAADRKAEWCRSQGGVTLVTE